MINLSLSMNYSFIFSRYQSFEFLAAASGRELCLAGERTCSRNLGEQDKPLEILCGFL